MEPDIVEPLIVEPIVAITTVPDHEIGVKIAQALVAEKLAACVHIFPIGTSIYRWQGAIEQASEQTLLIKSVRKNELGIQSILKRLHPYEVPELILLPVEGGSSAYLNWIRNEVCS